MTTKFSFFIVFAFAFFFSIKSAKAQKEYKLWYDKPAPNREGYFKIEKVGGKPYV